MYYYHTVSAQTTKNYNMSSSTLLVLFLLVSVSVAQRHNLIVCKPLIGDRLLAEKSCARSFKFLSYVSGTIHVKVTGNTINCIKAIDKWSDGTGGYAEITDGGIGKDYVTVKIRSQFCRGFWFVVEVHGQ
jgi:hypothetical protein